MCVDTYVSRGKECKTRDMICQFGNLVQTDGKSLKNGQNCRKIQEWDEAQTEIGLVLLSKHKTQGDPYQFDK